MPEVSCPISDCDYKTPDVEASIVTVLIDAHFKTHDNTLSKSNLHRLSNNFPNDQTLAGQPGQLIQSDSRNYSGIKGLVLGLVICIIALIIDITLAFTNNFWYRREDRYRWMNRTITVGLWQGCILTETKEEKTEQCWDHDDKKFPFNFMFVGAAQVFQCLGVIFLSCSVIAVIIKLTVARNKDLPVYFAGTYAFWGAVFLAGSSGVIGPGLKQISPEDTDYTKDIQMSSGIAVTSSIVALIGATILLLNKFVTNRMQNRNRLDNINKRGEGEDTFL